MPFPLDRRAEHARLLLMPLDPRTFPNFPPQWWLDLWPDTGFVVHTDTRSTMPADDDTDYASWPFYALAQRYDVDLSQPDTWVAALTLPPGHGGVGSFVAGDMQVIARRNNWPLKARWVATVLRAVGNAVYGSGEMRSCWDYGIPLLREAALDEWVQCHQLPPYPLRWMGHVGEIPLTLISHGSPRGMEVLKFRRFLRFVRSWQRDLALSRRGFGALCKYVRERGWNNLTLYGDLPCVGANIEDVRTVLDEEGLTKFPIALFGVHIPEGFAVLDHYRACACGYMDGGRVVGPGEWPCTSCRRARVAPTTGNYRDREIKLGRPSTYFPRRVGVELELCKFDEREPEAWSDFTRRARELRLEVKTDGSINAPSGFSGREIITSPMIGADATRTLEAFCDLLRDYGAKINRSCGLHVHVERWGSPVDHPKRYARLGALWSLLQPYCFEHVWRGSRRGNSYCRETPTLSFREALAAFYGRELDEEVEYLVRRWRDDRYYTLNLTSPHGTVEFRGSHATTDKEYVLRWSSACSRLVQLAGQARHPVCRALAMGERVTAADVAATVGLGIAA